MTTSAFGMARDLPAIEQCPCDSGRVYGECCGPLLAGAEIPTAEACMRSRYTAHVLGHESHLFRTWHPATRPVGALTQPTDWIGLQVLGVWGGGASDDAGEVEFSARFQDPDGRVHQMQERSSFARRAGRWVYVAAAG